MDTTQPTKPADDPNDVLNLGELIPEHFGRFMDTFAKGHHEGVVPSSIKELARLTVARVNQCDT